MKRLFLLIFLLLPFSVKAQNSYSTTFPLTENPISEGGHWINGKDTGLDWCNVQTGAPNADGIHHAFGVTFGTTTNCGASSYGDPVAVLTGVWGPHQQATATAYVNSGGPGTTFPEVELHTNMTITGHNITGYEFDCGLMHPGSPGPNFSVGFGIVRWNGPLGNWPNNTNNGFTLLASDPTTQCVQDGDVVIAVNTGAATGNLQWWKNGILILSATDHTYTNGSPGVGMNTSMDGTYPLSGWRSFSASDATFVPPTPPWSPNIASNRAIDWRYFGFPGDVLPDTALGWPTCKTEPTNVTAAQIITDLATCAGTVGTGSGQGGAVVVLPTGTLTMTQGIDYPTTGHVVLRGQGADKTKLSFTTSTTCPSGHAAEICMSGTDGTFPGDSQGNTGAGPSTPRVVQVNSGFTKGSFQLILSCVTSCVNIGTSGSTYNIAKGDILILNACNNGYTGTGLGLACTGTSADNSGLYWCEDHWRATLNGCAVPSEGGTISFRGEASETEAVQVSEINRQGCGATCVSLNTPIQMPDWNRTGDVQAVVIKTPMSFSGLEDLTVDVGPSGGSHRGVFLGHTQRNWISGVAVINTANYEILEAEAFNTVIKSNYTWDFLFTSINPNGDRAAIHPSGGCCDVIENNIFHASRGAIFSADAIVQGAEAILDNYAAPSTNGQNANCCQTFLQHGVSAYFLYENNNLHLISQDGDHGAEPLTTNHRNFAWGHVSCNNGQCGTTTDPNNGIDVSALRFFFGSRYGNMVNNVLGTPGWTTVYKSTATFANKAAFIFGPGQPMNAGSPPVFYPQPQQDPAIPTTTFLWGNCDTVNGYNNCQFNASENASSAPTYPNFTPASHSDAPSYYHNSKPDYYQNLTWPSVGFDITGGNVGQCSGVLNTVGTFNGVPAFTAGECGGSGITANAWNGLVYGNAAMNCYLKTMGGAPDGTGGPLTFSRTACYTASGPSAILTFSPSSENCGNVLVGANTNCGTVTTQNTGTVTATGISFTLSDTTNYNITGSSCTTTLAASASCSFTVHFTPTTAGSHPATYSVTSSASSNPTLVLSGTGINPVPVAVLTPSSMSFTAIQNNTSAGQTATLQNTGGANLVVSTAVVSAHFSNAGTGTCAGTSFTLAPSASCTIIVTFSPNAIGPFSGTLSVSDNASGSPHIVSLSGTGTGSVIVWNPTSYAFGNQVVGLPVDSSTLVLSNTGNITLNVVLTITGTDASLFNISATTCGATLTAGNSCNVTVRFTPVAVGSFSANLVETDVSQSISGSVALTGSGVTTTIVSAPCPWCQ